MKVIYIASASFPNGMAVTNRLIEYGEGLIKSGAKVNVWPISATDSYNDKGRYGKEGDFCGIHYQYPSSRKRNKNIFLRKINDVKDYLITVKNIFKLDKEDKVHIFMNSWGKEFIFLLCLKLKGIKVARELCEYPYATRDMASSKFSFLTWCQFKLVFPKYNGFVAISEELKKTAEKIKKAKVIKVPILVSPSSIEKETKKNDRPYIFHGGTMYERKDAIVSTMKAFAMANKTLKNSVDFILAGPKSPHQEELDQIIKEAGLESNVKFLGQLPKDKIEKWQNGASLAILNKHDNIQNRCGFSTKLGEILLSGTPVITTKVGEANNYLKDGESGYISDTSAPEEIASQIVRAFSDEPLRKQIALNSATLAKKEFSSDIHGKRLMEFYKSL